MAIKSYPFKAINTGSESAPVWDRSMSSGDDASRMDVFSNGVCGTNDFKVTAAGGNKVYVALGKVRIDGREGVIHTAPEEVTVSFTSAAANSVIIAAEKNLTDAVRAIRLVALKNEGGNNWPALTDTDEVRQVALARISIPLGASSITDDMITDVRPESGLEVAAGSYNAAGFLLLPGYLEKVQALSGAVLDLSAASLFTKTVTGDVSFSFSSGGITPGYGCSVLLVLKMTADATVTFPASVKWAGGMPVLKNGYSYELLFRSYDGGGSWIGSGSGGIANA